MHVTVITVSPGVPVWSSTVTFAINVDCPVIVNVADILISPFGVPSSLIKSWYISHDVEEEPLTETPCPPGQGTGASSIYPRLSNSCI